MLGCEEALYVRGLRCDHSGALIKMWGLRPLLNQTRMGLWVMDNMLSLGLASTPPNPIHDSMTTN